MTRDEEKLERARDKIHGPNPTAKDRAEFKRLSKRVATRRQAERRKREAAGPPVPANPGDAVVRPGTTS